LAGGPATGGGRSTVVVVDDDEQFLNLADVLLEGEGYRVILCQHSADAYAVLEREQPDLFVLDLRLETPESGWDILRAIRAHPIKHGIPVIICSAAIDDIQEHEAMVEAWDASVLYKPFDIVDFLRLVAESLEPEGQQENAGPGELPAC
jgi:CheY-like chemotaxis protein